MKFLPCLILLFSLPAFHVSREVRQPVESKTVTHARHQGGTWYFAETGHAVFCYGPVMTITQPEGGIQRVATFCRGDRSIVPLKD
jgi:hypothetical protein